MADAAMADAAMATAVIGQVTRCERRDAASDTELTSLTDPAGKVTQYVYSTNGDLTKATYDSTVPTR